MCPDAVSPMAPLHLQCNQTAVKSISVFINRINNKKELQKATVKGMDSQN